LGRFDSYILSQLVRVFGFFALVLVGIYWINRAVVLLDRYLSEGQSGGLVLQLTLLSLPGVMLIVLPVAGFVASAYVTNRLHADSELVVVQATGYSNFRLVRPYLVFAALLALGLSLLAHLVLPASFRGIEDLESELAEAISTRLIVPGSFQNPAAGVTVYVRDVAPDGTLRGLLLHDRRAPGEETTYNAHRAILVRHQAGPRLVMFEGMAQTLDTASGRLSVTEFEDFTVPVGEMVTATGPRGLDHRELPTSVLLDAPPEIVERTGRSVAYLRQEGHERISQALLAGGAAVLGFAALMLGGFSRFGLWRQIGLGVGLVVAVKLVDNAAIDAARSGPRMWPVTYAAPLLAAAVCLGLLVIGDTSPGRALGRRRRAAP